jgi:hypothetical protein
VTEEEAAQHQAAAAAQRQAAEAVAEEGERIITQPAYVNTRGLRRNRLASGRLAAVNECFVYSTADS